MRGQFVCRVGEGAFDGRAARLPPDSIADWHLGRQLRRRRRMLRLTQQQVAIAVGVRFQQIQKYECGETRISAARLWNLAKVLDVPVGYFFESLSQAEHRTAPESAVAARSTTRAAREIGRT